MATNTSSRNIHGSTLAIFGQFLLCALLSCDLFSSVAFGQELAQPVPQSPPKETRKFKIPLPNDKAATKTAPAVSSETGSSPTTNSSAKTAEAAVPADEEDWSDHVVDPRWDVAQVWGVVSKVWHFQVTTVSPNTPITVGTLITGLALFLAGYMAAKRIASLLEKRVFKRLGIPPSAAAPLHKIAFYSLVATFSFFTLNYLSVPLAAFAFLGGAFAIGIGFGSQNLMNNFISGLILLAEQPIRVGDVIQIDGLTGKVTEIGARSTRITTGANLEIIVPNSTFLQNNVINWTLSDDTISSNIKVGVSYGSPARLVAALLKQAAEESDKILQKPAPGVSFTNFGDHALEFELSFWIQLKQTDRGSVESELRFRIDDLFAQNGILVAYPQRDVHLNMLRPLEVRLSGSSGQALSLADNSAPANPSSPSILPASLSALRQTKGHAA